MCAAEALRRLHYLARRLLLDFFTNSSLNSLVLFFRNFFAHLSIGRIAAQDVGIKKSDSGKNESDNFSLQVIETPRQRPEH